MTVLIPKSRFRHVYGVSAKESNFYKNLKISKNTHDSNLSDVNQKFLAVAEESIGGGSFIVLKLSQQGRIPVDFPSVTGHRAAVTDIKWNPFNPQQIASCSDDSIVRIWNIPDDGITKNLNTPCAELKSHSSRAAHVRWHTLAENIIASAGADKKIIVWDINSLRPATAFGVLPDICYSIAWNFSGKLLGCTNKDRKLRIFDVRAEKMTVEANGHGGIRSSRICFLSDDQRLLTCGFSKHGSRQVAIWDLRNMSVALTTNVVDQGSGVLLVHYDPDLQIVYLIGKGDGNFRYYEILNTDPYFYYLSEYVSSHPQRSFCAMPKLGLDFSKNEIARIYKLYATGSLCEPISIIVPRKSEQFQSDIYPDTLDSVPAMTADEWLAGENRSPRFVSVKELQKSVISVKKKFNLQRSEEYQDSSEVRFRHDSEVKFRDRSISNPTDAYQSNSLQNDMDKRYQNTNEFFSPPEMLYTPITKRNTVLDNVRKLEDTIKKFNNDRYSPTSQYNKSSHVLYPRFTSTAMWPNYEIECSSNTGAISNKNTQCLYRIQIAIPMINKDTYECQSNKHTVLTPETKSSTDRENSFLSFWKSKHITWTGNHVSAATQDAQSEISKSLNRKVKEMSQVFERLQGGNENELSRKHRPSKSFSSKESEVIKSRKEVRFTDKETNNTTQVNINTTLLRAAPLESKHRGRDSSKRRSNEKVSDKNSEVDLTNVDGNKTDQCGSYVKSEGNNTKLANANGVSKGNDMTCSQTLHKPERACEHWKNVKELNKRILIHEERIRQLEAKVNEFVYASINK